MTTLSYCDRAVDNSTILSKPSCRFTFGQLLVQLSNGKKVAIQQDAFTSNFLKTVETLQFEDEFEKRMFYRTLSVIAIDRRFSGIPLFGDWLRLIYLAFKIHVKKELQELTLLAINRGSDYTVLYNQLIDFANQHPGYVHLRWYWLPKLRELAQEISKPRQSVTKVIWSSDITLILGWLKETFQGSNFQFSQLNVLHLRRELRSIPIHLFYKRETLYQTIISKVTGLRWVNKPGTNINLSSKVCRLGKGLVFLFDEKLKECNQSEREVKFGVFIVWFREEFPYLYKLIVQPPLQRLYEYIDPIYPFERVLKYLPKFLLRNLDTSLIDHTTRPILIRLLAGNNLRTYRYLPFPVSKKIAHYAMKSPHSDLAKAYFYGLTGGNSRLAYEMARFWDCPSDDFEFLKTLVPFFKGYPNHLSGQLRRSLGYIRHRRDEDGDDFSLSGRTWASLNRLVNQYFTDIAQRRILLDSWSSERIPTRWKGARYEEWNQFFEGQWYAIFQLISAADLYEEGSMMSHCVGGYARKCARKQCSIWSLRRNDDGSWTSLVTIEIDSNNRVVQAKGKYNTIPNNDYQRMIKEWTNREEIII